MNIQPNRQCACCCRQSPPEIQPHREFHVLGNQAQLCSPTYHTAVGDKNVITAMSSCMWGEQLPVRAQLQQICPLISSAAWVRRAEHEGFLAFCSVELAELIRMTATSASVQRKGQWLRLDARQFSRQLENTMKAHSIHAAGTEALPVETSTEDVTVEGRRLEDDSTELACHCTSFIPTFTLHSEGMSSSLPLCTACVTQPVSRTSLCQRGS